MKLTKKLSSAVYKSPPGYSALILESLRPDPIDDSFINLIIYKLRISSKQIGDSKKEVHQPVAFFGKDQE